jgi:DNA-binding CsgD family transcriptional regulator/tetratricopeptide (TPR) repeat protein
MREEARAAGDRAGEGRALAWLSYVHRRRYDPAAAHDAAAAALEIADAVGEPRLQALVHWNLAHTHEIGGNLDLSLRHGREAERLARASGARDLLGRGLQVLAQLAIWHARYPEAERYAREALDLARETRDALALAAAHWRLGIALGEAGRYGEARAVLLAGIAGAETAGERYYLAKLLNTLGWLHLELGDAEGAERWDARALETARGSHGGRVTEAERYTLLNLATDALAAGRIDAAAAHLDAFAPLLEHRDYGRFRYLNRYQLLRGEVALAQERHEEALRFAGEAERFAAAKEMPKNVVKGKLLTGRALLELGRVRPATATLADAVTMADRIGHGSLRWQARFWAGRATGAAGGDPAPLYAEASRLLQGLASAVDDAELRNRLLAAPSARALTIATADRDAGAAARPAGLTAREVEVLLLLASHRTNNEIADELFVSPRTVTTHVANIFNKLGVSNRRDAAEAAVRLGLPGPSRRVSPGTT